VVKARVGEPFTIDLPSSASTGYRWVGPEAPKGSEDPQAPEAAVELLEQWVDVPAEVKPGSASTQRFRLVARRAGPVRLTFILKRSWEPHGVDTRVVDVEVDE
jgi:hypothetical protein